MQPEIQGWTDPRFNEVRRTFEHSVSNYDAGAAFSVYVDGDCVVDLWGGHADTAQNRLWEKDTAVFMMSGSKGVLAAALARAATIGLIDYRTPVAHYWPEFAAEGKAEITVSQCVTYIGGLPGFVEPVSQLDLMDSPRIADMLARQAPARPGTLLYGPYALGFVVDELFRRTAGVDASEFFHREIALPHDIRIAWGEQYERHGWGTLATIEYESAFEHQYDDYVNSTDPLTKMIWANPAPFPLGDRVWNTPERRARPLAAANCAAPAREIAKLYDVLSRDLRGLNGSAGLIASPEVMAAAIGREFVQPDYCLGFDFAYGLGGFRRKARRTDSFDHDLFGHDGGGGSAHFAWPGAGVALSFTPNRFRDLGNNDQRAKLLMNAVKNVLGAAERESA